METGDEIDRLSDAEVFNRMPDREQMAMIRRFRQLYPEDNSVEFSAKPFASRAFRGFMKRWRAEMEISARAYLAELADGL